ncbi:hypothetical protein BDN72DRAFT_865476 [Pluteus cervinus]|uniref:Uncharacterized protein n=1 Tax=Pluteus cervinus TaxID=181527 RepID=A0ACD3A0A2_9AGAR|nr:hypothetical protein BDN72DRAFT_865476 [Pluteus cervinus]
MKITSTTTASEETIEGVAEIPRINSTDSRVERIRNHWLTSTPISHREVSSGLPFHNSYQTLLEDFHLRRRSVIWQESESISQMQVHSECISSMAANCVARRHKQMIPLLDWRLLQGPMGSREQMNRYAKRDPIFVASLVSKRNPVGSNLDQMLSWLSETIINVQKLCTQPMLLITLNAEMTYIGEEIKLPASWRIDISIVETGYTTRIPRYQQLHDPIRPRPPTFPPPRSVPVSTANPSSSNNKQLIPKKKSSPKLGPTPPSVLPLPNVKPGSGVSRIPRHKDTFSRPVIPSSSSEELTIRWKTSWDSGGVGGFLVTRCNGLVSSTQYEETSDVYLGSHSLFFDTLFDLRDAKEKGALKQIRSSQLRDNIK